VLEKVLEVAAGRGNCREVEGRAGMAIGGQDSLAGWKRCPKPGRNFHYRRRVEPDPAEPRRGATTGSAGLVQTTGSSGLVQTTGSAGLIQPPVAGKLAMLPAMASRSGSIAPGAMDRPVVQGVRKTVWRQQRGLKSSRGAMRFPGPCSPRKRCSTARMRSVPQDRRRVNDSVADHASFRLR
jgi:hypothetical protein